MSFLLYHIYHILTIFVRYSLFPVYQKAQRATSEQLFFSDSEEKSGSGVVYATPSLVFR